MNDITKMLDKIIHGNDEIRKIELSVKEETEAVEKLVLKRLSEYEAVSKANNPKYGGYGDPTPSASGSFHVYDINVRNDYSVTFNWSDDWAYGGHDEGHMTFTKEEFVDGDFSALEAKVKAKWVSSKGGIF